MSKILKIVRVHNELLGTYGDQGNAEVLAYRAELRSIRNSIVDVKFNDTLPKDGSIYLLGGAEDRAQILSAQNLRDGSLRRLVQDGVVLLSICAGFQIAGISFEANDQVHGGLGIFDAVSASGFKLGKKRFVGELKIDSSITNLVLTGFENHSGYSKLFDGTLPLGKVIVGHGNGISKIDGAVYLNAFGTYMHGPVLARNPEFADLLLSKALGKPIEPLNDILARDLSFWHKDRIKNNKFYNFRAR